MGTQIVNSILLCGSHARALRQAHYYGPLFLVMALMPNECSFVIIFPKGRRGLYYILTCCLAIVIWLKFLGPSRLSTLCQPSLGLRRRRCLYAFCRLLGLYCGCCVPVLNPPTAVPSVPTLALRRGGSCLVLLCRALAPQFM